MSWTKYVMKTKLCHGLFIPYVQYYNNPRLFFLPPPPPPPNCSFLFTLSVFSIKRHTNLSYFPAPTPPHPRFAGGEKCKSVHSCRFVHHAKFHCIIITLNKLFKIEFERGETGKEAFYVVTRGFTRLSKKTKYVCYSLIILHTNCCKNPMMWTKFYY